MPTGHYRFRRSLGNVGSLFRGARPDTYPLTDPDVLAFAEESGATDLDGLNNLVTYLKGESLYSNFVIYPMKSAQNAGSGATVYSLGGLTTNNMTLTNSPSWGATGITYDGVDQSGSIIDFLGSETITSFARHTINFPQDADDTILSQWDTGAANRSWLYSMSGAGLAAIIRSADGGGVNLESYTGASTLLDNVDATAVAQWTSGGGRALWANKSAISLSLAAGSPQTSRFNSDSMITIMAGLNSTAPFRFTAGLVNSVALINTAITTTQRESITDLINAL